MYFNFNRRRFSKGIYLSVVGRDYYGVFPLKGKVLNVRDVTEKKIYENEEINNIKKIIRIRNR